MHRLLVPLVFAIVASAPIALGVPQTLHHQGRIASGGINFDGTGQFKFLLYHSPTPGTVTAPLWKNDDPAPANDSEPATAVSTPVTKGLYSVQLGEAPQAALPPNLTPPTSQDLYLRIWFDDGTKGSQLLLPDRSINAVPFAKHADISGQNISSLNNDAGFLTAGGDITANSYQLSAAVAKKLQIHPASFTTEHHSLTHSYGFDGGITPGDLGDSATIVVAPVSLPAGATVTAFNVLGHDESANYDLSINAAFFRREETSITVQTVGARILNMTGSLPAMRSSTSTSISNPIVSENYQYHVRVGLSQTGSGSFVNGPAFYGISIEYTIDQL